MISGLDAKAGVNCHDGPGSKNPVENELAMKTWGKVIDEMVIKCPAALNLPWEKTP